MIIRWYVGLTVDPDGTITRWVRDPKSEELVRV
jgi:hypothetical protein